MDEKQQYYNSIYATWKHSGEPVTLQEYCLNIKCYIQYNLIPLTDDLREYADYTTKIHWLNEFIKNI